MEVTDCYLWAHIIFLFETRHKFCRLEICCFQTNYYSLCCLPPRIHNVWTKQNRFRRQIKVLLASWLERIVIWIDAGRSYLKKQLRVRGQFYDCGRISCCAVFLLKSADLIIPKTCVFVKSSHFYQRRVFRCPSPTHTSCKYGTSCLIDYSFVL